MSGMVLPMFPKLAASLFVVLNEDPAAHARRPRCLGMNDYDDSDGDGAAR